MFRKKITNIDDTFQGLAWMLSNEDNPATHKRQLLDSGKLDYSVNSLEQINNYLDQVGQDKEFKSELVRNVLRLGAYVGEVIRKEYPLELHWYDYKSAVKIDKKIEQFGEQLGTYAVLSDGKKLFYFPIAKVLKYIENSREDDLRTFAKVIIGNAGGAKNEN